MTKNTMFEIIRYILGVLIGALISFVGVIKWKTGMDFRVSENEKDIENLKAEKKDYVKTKDFDEIKKTLHKIEDKLFEIAKNMPVKK
ncbi:hypothetical protein KAH94_03145 [bacterium]|nr:hypothetical protein [bacterium]